MGIHFSSDRKLNKIRPIMTKRVSIYEEEKSFYYRNKLAHDTYMRNVKPIPITEITGYQKNNKVTDPISLLKTTPKHSSLRQNSDSKSGDSDNEQKSIKYNDNYSKTSSNENSIDSYRRKYFNILFV